MGAVGVETIDHRPSRGTALDAIRILETIDLDTPHIPELENMIDRTVEIIVLEEPFVPASSGAPERRIPIPRQGNPR